MNTKQSLLAEIAARLEKLDSAHVSLVSQQDEFVFACDQSLRIQVDPDPHPGSQELSHYHVLAQIGSDDSKNLDACIVGIGETESERISDAANMWISLVAGPLLTLLNGKALLEATPFGPNSPHGILGSHGAVGPRLLRDYSGTLDSKSLEGINLFQGVDALAGAETLQLAKATLQAKNGNWSRHLEINGHQHSYSQPAWDCGLQAPSLATVTQFALFHFAENTQWLESRRQTDKAIKEFVKGFSQTQNVASALKQLEASGFSAKVVHQVHVFTSLAFSRYLFGEFGARYSDDYFRVLADGSVESKSLMKEAVFARSLMFSPGLQSGPLSETFQTLALLNTEFNHLNELMNEGRTPESIQLSAPVLADPGVDEKTLARAMKTILKTSTRCES